MATCDMFESITTYYQLYKLSVQSHVKLVKLEQDNFLYLSSFMDKYFSGNVFKFLILFNLLTFIKRVLNLAGSLTRSESHLLCVVIGCSPVMSHLLCVVIGCSPLMSHIHVHTLH